MRHHALGKQAKLSSVFRMRKKDVLLLVPTVGHKLKPRMGRGQMY